MNKTLALATIALFAVIMVMSSVAPALADHDKGNGESNDDNDERQNCKDGPPSNGEEGWNCKAGEPRPAPGKP